MEKTWVEISEKAIRQNVGQLRALIGRGKILCVCVKANAYGHGMVEVAKLALSSGADWLAVDSIREAETLRGALGRASYSDCTQETATPIYVMGFVPPDQLKLVIDLDLRIVVYDLEMAARLAKLAESKNKTLKIHLKIETGNNRQGILLKNLEKFVRKIKELKNLEIEGVCSHFANIEDTTDHAFAMRQLEAFNLALAKMRVLGVIPKIRHIGNTAATLLFPEMHFEMVRVGIGAYGLWPSNETYVSSLKEREGGFKLMPAFSWKTVVAQVKEVEAGEFIGYGCSYKTSHLTKLAVLPVGYYDGYDRGVKDAYVLIKAKRAPVRGRICMNIMMVEVTDIPGVKVGDEVTLIGRDGQEEIKVEDFALWAGTINYEVVTRVRESIARKLV